MSRHAPPLRTYSHLAGRNRIPTEYELASSHLLYYGERGFEVDVPVGPWYERHQRQGRLASADWEGFADPRETTYSSYTAIQAEKESHLDAVLRSIDSSGDDARLSPEWRALLERVVPPLRYVWHGFQMVAAYVGQMAPSGRVTLVAMFQAADEMRRIHRVAYRMAQLRQGQPDFGAAALAHWQERPAWQPLRRTLEHALIAYDWGEAFVALCLCLKPALDLLVISELGAIARNHHDFFFAEILASFDEDCRWQRAWTEVLVLKLRQERPENAAALRFWVGKWLPGAQAASRAVAELCGPEGRSAAAGAERTLAEWLRRLELLEEVQP